MSRISGLSQTAAIKRKHIIKLVGDSPQSVDVVDSSYARLLRLVHRDGRAEPENSKYVCPGRDRAGTMQNNNRVHTWRCDDPCERIWAFAKFSDTLDSHNRRAQLRMSDLGLFLEYSSARLHFVIVAKVATGVLGMSSVDRGLRLSKPTRSHRYAFSEVANANIWGEVDKVGVN